MNLRKTVEPSYIHSQIKTKTKTKTQLFLPTTASYRSLQQMFEEVIFGNPFLPTK